MIESCIVFDMDEASTQIYYNTRQVASWAFDGDSFIYNGNGIGISSDYAGTIAASEWNRITITFDDSQLSYYINGSLVNQVSSTADRFNVGSSLLILVDNGAETSEALLNNLAFWDHTLSEVEVSGFGGASAGAIVPEPSVYAMLIGLAALGVSMIRRRS